ncbi:hypothetical protein C4572_04225, partial [Candidatus Parcubacteria bacterium]
MDSDIKTLENKLRELGLADKEARVYLASLELGSDTVQNIAKKAKVNRATTHVIIMEKLIKKGLMSSFKKDKKTFYQVESPEQLMRLLRDQEEDIKRKEEEFKKYLPELETLYSIAEEKPKVRFFEGKEGLISIREDYFKAKDKEVLGFFAIDEEKNIFSEEERQRAAAERKNKNIQIKLIYTDEEPSLRQESGLSLRRFVPREKFPLSSTFIIYDNKVGVVSL